MPRQFQSRETPSDMFLQYPQFQRSGLLDPNRSIYKNTSRDALSATSVPMTIESNKVVIDARPSYEASGFAFTINDKRSLSRNEVSTAAIDQRLSRQSATTSQQQSFPNSTLTEGITRKGNNVVINE